MAITLADLAIALVRAEDAAKRYEQVLNNADSKLGDGDTGGMLARVIGKMAEQDVAGAADLGAAFSSLAKSAASATGSSLGTLLATALLVVGRDTKGRDCISIDELPKLLETARDAMIARGGARLGDKTVLDSLDAVIACLQERPKQPAEAIARAAEDALHQFRDRPNRIGRARMFGDATIGVDDPGMLAFSLLCAGVAGRSDGPKAHS